MHTLCKDAVRSPRKMDAAMAAVLSWKARSDAVELGVVQLEPGPGVPVEPEAKRPAAFDIGRGLAVGELRLPSEDGHPMGSMM
jgi:hypothetical protein